MLDLETAIKHCEEVADKQEQMARGIDGVACKERAVEYRQLAEWLRELKDLRILIGGEDNYLNEEYK